MTHMPNKFSRRGMLALLAGGAVLSVTPALALGTDAARALIEKSLGEVYAVINSGQPPARMYQDFEAIFARYADVDVIARSALGPVARGLPAAEFAAYRTAFLGYIGRKYGKRFREFIGSKIEVQDARPLKSFYEVRSVAYLKGRAPMEVLWHVSDKSGKSLYFNIIIEGVNMLASERSEIAALLAKSGGDVGRLTEALRAAG